MKKVLLSLFLVIFFLESAHWIDRIMAPKEIAATMVLIDENGKTILSLSENIEPPVNAVLQASEIIKYTYIPRWSAIRTASSWYDRKIEHYYVAKDGGSIELKSCSLFEYRYPIFSGELRVVEKKCAE